MRRLRGYHLAFLLCSVALPEPGWAQSAGGMAATITNVRYTPVAFPQLVQLSNFNTTTITLAASDANGGALTYSLVSGPSLGSVGALDPASGQIQYTPPAGFSTTDSFTFLVSDGVLSSETATVTIFAPKPSVRLSAASLDLGSQVKGVKSSSRTVTINNTSVASLSIGAIAINGTNATDFAIENTGTCPSNGSLAAGGGCTVAISFTPGGTGARSATLTTTDNAPDSPQNLALTGNGTDYSVDLAPSGSASTSVSAGQTATYNLQISSTNGFTGTVTLSCSGAPAHASCTPNPPTLNITGTTAAFSVNVATAARSSSAPGIIRFTGRPTNFVPLFSAALGLFVILLAAMRLQGLRRWRPATLLFGVFLLSLVLTSCGGGGGGSSAPPPVQTGTPTGTYALTVTGASGGASRNLALTLTVQ